MGIFKTNKPQNQPPRQRRQPSTISGERQRPEMFSYRAQRGERVDNPRRTAPLFQGLTANVMVDRGKVWRRLKYSFVVGLLLLLVVSQSLLTKPPKIVFDGANATAYHYDANSYTATAQRLAASSIFNKTKWTFNAPQLNNAMQKAFPEIASVSTTLPLFGNAPTVHLVPGVPRLLDTTTTNQTYVVDERGVAVATTKTSQPVPGLLTIQDQSGIPVHVGQPALPSSTVTFIEDLKTQLHSQHIEVTSGVLTAQSSELDVHIAGLNYIGKFNLLSDVRLQAGAFAAVKGKLDASHTGVGQYIDVRLVGRAYYK